MKDNPIPEGARWLARVEGNIEHSDANVGTFGWHVSKAYLVCRHFEPNEHCTCIFQTELWCRQIGRHIVRCKRFIGKKFCFECERRIILPYAQRQLGKMYKNPTLDDFDRTQ